MARYARRGRVEWIGLRAARRALPATPESAHLTSDGFEADHAAAGKRAVTLIQAEHLPVIAALAGLDAVDPAALRRNLMISGLNLAAFRKARLQIGTAVVEITGPCPPCSRMEEALGPGGYTAMRGHGGFYASVVAPGTLELGAAVHPARG
ncbi:MAG: MOSC domain-containing protein [Pseudomonadota bacterium]